MSVIDTSSVSEGIATEGAPKRRRGIASVGGHQRTIGFAMVTPAVIFLILFFFVPVFLAFGLAFTNARLVSPRPAEFVGLTNFLNLFSDSVFWASLRNTLYFAVIVVPVQAGLALVLALLVNGKFRGTNFFRTVYFLPVVTSMVVISLLWEFMYQPDGLFNSIIRAVSFGNWQGTDWLNNPATAMPAIMVMSIWSGRGLPHDHLAGWAPDDSRRALRGGGDRRSVWLEPFQVHHLAGTHGNTHVHPHHDHDLGAQPVHTDQRNDSGRATGFDDHRGLHGGAYRLGATSDRLRVSDLADLLRACPHRLRHSALPDSREGLRWLPPRPSSTSPLPPTPRAGNEPVTS